MRPEQGVARHQLGPGVINCFVRSRLQREQRSTRFRQFRNGSEPRRFQHWI